MELGGESSNEGLGARDSDSPCSSNMAVIAMVSQITGTANITTPENLLRGTSDNGAGNEAQQGANSAPSCVAYLRQQYADLKLSGEATDHHHGDRSCHSHMTPSVKNGLAGVLNRIQSLFQDLQKMLLIF